MSDYNFKYKPHRKENRRTLNSFFSNIFIKLYKNKLFQKLKLNKNRYLKYIIDNQNKGSGLFFKCEIPENPAIEPFSVTLYDLVDFKEFVDNRKIFERLLSKYKSRPSSFSPKYEIDDAFDKLSNSYKVISYGSFCQNDLRHIPKADLIDSISYGYIKGEQLYMILSYTLFPSKKFVNAFKKCINEQIRDDTEIIFNSFKNILKGEKWIISINRKPIYPISYINSLYNELMLQFKLYIISDLNFGLFNTNDKILFPYIVTYEYNKTQTDVYFKGIKERLDIIDWDLYSDDSIMIHFPKKNYSTLEIFLPKNEVSDDLNSQFESVLYRSDNYVKAISSFWTLLNVTELHKATYVTMRKKTFSYFKQNKDSLFFSKAINLKRDLNSVLMQMEEICKDFSSEIFNEHPSFFGIPDLKTSYGVNNNIVKEFKQDLINTTKLESDDLIRSFIKLNNSFSKISNDNLIRSNMRLQKILLIVAIISILLTTYGANFEWFNNQIVSWIKDLFCK